MKPLHELTATEAAREISAGRLTSLALVGACLERIREREPDVAAWSYLNPEQALAAARQSDAASGGVLRGIPVGFKDIVDTADMPTTYGSPIYRDWRPAVDAVCVANTRRAGGVVLGKTVSTEFASRYPGPTRNPHHCAHTPGGSSSGSAAAVADCMVPLAIGTQTAGSVIRPAAYCGVFGYKASYGLLSFSGVKHLAESVDTLGCMARSVEDIALFRAALLGVREVQVAELGRAPRIGLCRTPLWDEAEASTQSLLEEGLSRLAKAGAQVSEIELPQEFVGSDSLHERLTRLEVRNCLTHERETAWDNLSPSAQASIEAGDQVELAQYLADQRSAARLRVLIEESMRGLDALITPSAPGEAPLGLAFTGPIPFNYLWTLVHTPAVTVPAFTGPRGLPVGLQVIAPRWEDDRALAVAQWIARHLD